MTICFIQTGGTIDKDYPKNPGAWCFEINQPAVEHFLKYLGPQFDYSMHSLCKKDSQEISNADREKLVEMISQIESTQMIITHGTDTMIETGLFIQEKKLNKTIVLTGASVPWKLKETDAEINIGMAIACAQILENGVYICMHGKVIPILEAKRDPKTGLFYHNLPK